MQLNNSLLWRTKISPSSYLMTLFNGEVPTHLVCIIRHEIWTCIPSIWFDKSNPSYNRRAFMILCWIRLLYKEHNLYTTYIFVLWWIIYKKKIHTENTLALPLDFLFVWICCNNSHSTIKIIAVFNFRNFHCDTQYNEDIGKRLHNKNVAISKERVS